MRLPPNTIAPDPNATGLQVSALLTNLQNEMEVALLFVAAFNDSFDFVPLQTNGAVGQALALGHTAGATNNSVTNLGLSLTRPTALAMAATTNALGVPPGFAAFPLTRDTLRNLVLLQNDLRRMLSLLNAVNTGNNTSPQAPSPVPSPTGR